jgi:DNA-binding NarL/FixJ family response regulator
MLIIDDNKPFRRMFCDALWERFKYLEIQEAGDLVEGLQKFLTFHPSLIVLDISLPDGNGLELAESIRRKSPQTVIALCTMHDSPEYRQAARSLGISHFFVKEDLDWEAIGELMSVELSKKRMVPDV